MNITKRLNRLYSINKYLYGLDVYYIICNYNMCNDLYPDDNRDQIK